MAGAPFSAHGVTWALDPRNRSHLRGHQHSEVGSLGLSCLGLWLGQREPSWADWIFQTSGTLSCPGHQGPITEAQPGPSVWTVATSMALLWGRPQAPRTPLWAQLKGSDSEPDLLTFPDSLNHVALEPLAQHSTVSQQMCTEMPHTVNQRAQALTHGFR